LAHLLLDSEPSHGIRSFECWPGERALEFQARVRELHESIQARHAAELAAAGFFRRLLLGWRIAAEFRRERRKIEPSPGSLYSNQTVVRMPDKEEGS